MKITGFWGGSKAYKEAAAKKEFQELRRSGYGLAFATGTLSDRVRTSMAMKRKIH